MPPFVHENVTAATIEHWLAIELEWRAENAGCCAGCGIPLFIPFPPGHGCCAFCTISLRGSEDDAGNRRGSTPNAAWKRHDRELVTKLLTAWGSMEQRLPSDPVPPPKVPCRHHATELRGLRFYCAACGEELRPAARASS